MMTRPPTTARPDPASHPPPASDTLDPDATTVPPPASGLTTLANPCAPPASIDRDASTSIEPDPTRAFRPDPDSPLPTVPGFELHTLLGRGAFASVYLARQLDLDRFVALKLTAEQGGEARTLASLEHPHIVQVFSESLDYASGLRVLCMQYVPGTTLERVLKAARPEPHPSRSGRSLLDAIDALSALPTTLDPGALRDRDRLARSDAPEAACLLGQALAEALAYAHARGVLHRDIKPANILLDPYGRPHLADFNLALDDRDARAGRPESFGGTLAYMAPEHIDAFNPADPTSHSAVDARSDIYSLGVVLFELLAGPRPFERPEATASGVGTPNEMADRRRLDPPSPRDRNPEVPEPLDRAVRRCLAPDPAQRFQDAAQLARALEGCRELHRLQRRLPPAGRLLRAARRRPATWLVLLLFLPHLVGSAVNIAYNAIEIVSQLTPAQKSAFNALLVAYNLLVYPACLWAFARLITPVFRTAWDLRRGLHLPDDRVRDARRRALDWPRWAILLSLVGWIPGSLLFPLGIHLMAGPLPAPIFQHFFISFWTSGLIALTYSYFGVQFLVLRVLYPTLWSDAAEPRLLARQELAGRQRGLHLFQLLAGLIPLIAATLLVANGPDPIHSLPYRLLTTSLILAGMIGFGVAMLVTGQLVETLHVLTGVRSDRPDP